MVAIRRRSLPGAASTSAPSSSSSSLSLSLSWSAAAHRVLSFRCLLLAYIVLQSTNVAYRWGKREVEERQQQVASNRRHGSGDSTAAGPPPLPLSGQQQQQQQQQRQQQQRAKSLREHLEDSRQRRTDKGTNEKNNRNDDRAGTRDDDAVAAAAASAAAAAAAAETAREEERWRRLDPVTASMMRKRGSGPVAGGYVVDLVSERQSSGGDPMWGVPDGDYYGRLERDVAELVREKSVKSCRRVVILPSGRTADRRRRVVMITTEDRCLGTETPLIAYNGDQTVVRTVCGEALSPGAAKKMNSHCTAAEPVHLFPTDDIPISGESLPAIHIQNHPLPPSSMDQKREWTNVDCDVPCMVTATADMMDNQQQRYVIQQRSVVGTPWTMKGIANAESQFPLRSTSPECRTCRWTHAKLYGLGWDHDRQRVRENVIPRHVCIDDETATKLVTEPFRETWLQRGGETSSQQQQQDSIVLAAASATTTTQRDRTCGPSLNSETTITAEDSAVVTRTVTAHDGVIDMVLHGIQPTTRSADLILRLEGLSVRNTDGAYFPDTHAAVSGLRHGPLVSSATLQDSRVKVTVLANWDTEIRSSSPTTAAAAAAAGAAAAVTSSPLEGTLEIVIQYGNDAVSKGQETARRLRIVTEDADPVHEKMTEYRPSHFAELVIRDFVDPVQYFYADS